MSSLRSMPAIAVVIAVSAAAADAQRSRRPAATQRVEATAPAPAPKASLLVLPIAGDTHDSARTIIERDLDYSDRFNIVRVPPAASTPLVPVEGAAPPFSALAPLGVERVVLASRSGSALRVAAYDVTGARLVAERTFEVPRVPSLRPEQIRDSLTRAFDERDLTARARLAALAAVRDSLLRAPEQRRDRVRAAAVRDSMLDAIAYEQGSLIASMARATIERDSLLPVLLAADTAAHVAGMRGERMALHAVSDEVQLWLTGRRGIAASRIAFVRNGRVFAIDSDGANEEPLTDQGAALSPSWHPTGRSIVFSDLADAGTQIAEVDLTTRRVQFLNATPRGLNLTPVYSPDGNRIVYSTSFGGGESRLVYVARGSNVAVPIPGVAGDASSPSFSPDGRKLAFISPRPWTVADGSPRFTPQIFTLFVDSARAGQLTPSTYGVRSYRTSPDWSPDGQYVAFMQQNGDFQVWMIGVNDGRMRKLTTFAENEDPTWAPDSRHLAIASTRSGAKQIWILDVESGRARQLTSSGGARLPDWSPNLGFPRPVVVAAGGGNP